MPRRPPDPTIVASVLKLVRSGCSASEIQDRLGVPRSTVTRWARAAEAPATLDASDDIAAAVEVLGDTWTFAGAAELAGVSEDAVRTWLRARVDRLLLLKGLPVESAQSDLQFSQMRA
jgi:transposase